MKNCPTSNMNRSRFWGLEVGHIVSAFGILAGTNVLLNIVGGPLILSWGFGIVMINIYLCASHAQADV